MSCAYWLWLDKSYQMHRAQCIQIHRSYYSLFLWFILSEVLLFGSLLYVLNYTNLTSLEFIPFHFLPLEFSQAILHSFCSFNFVAFDLTSVVANSWFLAASGTTANACLYSMAVNWHIFENIHRLYSVTLAWIFICHQWTEFYSFPITANTNTCCSSSICLESVHFIHLILGCGAFFCLKKEKGEAGDLGGSGLRMWWFLFKRKDESSKNKRWEFLWDL